MMMAASITNTEIIIRSTEQCIILNLSSYVKR